jgi:hypothetical protein
MTASSHLKEATVLHRLAFKRAHEEPLTKLALVGTDQIVGPVDGVLERTDEDE